MSIKCSIVSGKIPVDVFVLHGYRSTVQNIESLIKFLKNLGYNVITCEYPGHGFLRGDRKELFNTMLQIEEMVKNRQNPVVLIGHSMGGAFAISIGSNVKDVRQVFGISAPNGLAFANYKHFKKAERMVAENFDLKAKINLMRVMPIFHGTCDTKNIDKFFLIHGRNDPLVPIQEMYSNMNMLCIPDENVKIFDKLTGIGRIDHNLSFRSKEVLDFIANHIIKR